jgi:hypothetical protein
LACSLLRTLMIGSGTYQSISAITMRSADRGISRIDALTASMLCSRLRRSCNRRTKMGCDSIAPDPGFVRARAWCTSDHRVGTNDSIPAIPASISATTQCGSSSGLLIRVGNQHEHRCGVLHEDSPLLKAHFSSSDKVPTPELPFSAAGSCSK